MKYCKNCGSQIEDEAVVCVSCGCSTANFETYAYGLVVFTSLPVMYSHRYRPAKRNQSPTESNTAENHKDFRNKL